MNSRIVIPVILSFSVLVAVCDCALAGKKAKSNTYQSVNFEMEGERYFQAGQFDKAIACYNKAIELWPECSAYLSRAMCHEKLANYKLAIEDYSRYIDIGFIRKIGSYPAFECYRGRAYCYDVLDEADKALADCQKAREFASREIVTEKTAVEINFLCGLAYLLKGRPQLTLTEIAVYLNLVPENAQAYLVRARAFNALSRYQEALNDLQRALELKSADTLLLSEQSFAYAGAGQYDKALEVAQLALSANPASYRAWLAKAWALQALGHKHEAVEAADRALALKSNSQIALKLKGILPAETSLLPAAPADDPPAASVEFP